MIAVVIRIKPTIVVLKAIRAMFVLMVPLNVKILMLINQKIAETHNARNPGNS